MILPILLILALQSAETVNRPGQPPPTDPNKLGDAPTSVMMPGVANHYANGLPVVGTLVFPDDAKEKVADVELYDSSGQLIQKVTISDSRFQFNRIPIGIYTIDVKAKDMETAHRQLVLNESNFGTVEVSIDLHRRVDTAKDLVLDAKKMSAPISKDAIKEYEKAMEEDQRGDPSKAIPHLEKAVKISPNYFDAILQLGLYYKQTGNFEGALSLLNLAIQLNPAAPTARLALGQLYFEKEQFQAAIDQMKEELKSGPGNPIAYYTMGVSYYKLNQLAPAEENLRQSLKISEQTMGKAHLQLYNVYMKAKRTNDALTELNAYLEKHPDAADRQVVQALAQKLKNQKTP